MAESSRPDAPPTMQDDTTSAENVDLATESIEEMNKDIFPNPLAPLSHFRKTSANCTYLCSCKCHRLGGFRTPEILRSIVGSIFIDYSGIPVLNSKCDNTACVNANGQSSLRISYYFPRWFLSRMVSAILSYNLRDGPELSHLRTPRVRPVDAAIFVTAREGDVVKMRRLFKERSASPFDVDVNGYSALFVSHLSQRTYCNHD